MPVSIATPADKQIGENRFAIFSVILIGATTSLGTVGLASGTPRLIPWFIGGAVLWAAWRVARLPRSLDSAPSRTFLEYLLATLSASFSYQIIVGMALGFAAIVFWLIEVVNYGAFLFGAGWRWPAWTAAYWTGAVVGAFFLLAATTVAIDKVRSQLFAPKFGGRSAFYDLAIYRRGKLIRTVAFHLIGIVVAGLFWLKGSGIGSGFWLLFTLYLAGVSSQIYDAGDPSNDEKRAMAALIRLFEALGCQIIREPKTSDPAVDRLLDGLDLVAHSQDRVWGITVKGSDEKGHLIEWTAGAGLLSAVTAYREKRTEFAGIEPVMVLVGAEAHGSLASFSRAEGMRLIQLDLPVVEKVIASTKNGELRELAEKLFIRQSTEVAPTGEGTVA